MDNLLTSKVQAAINKLNLTRIIKVALTRGVLTLSSLGIYALLGNAHGSQAISDYAVYIAAISLLGNLIALGIPQMLMRRIAINRSNNNNYLTKLRSIYWQYLIISTTSITIILLIICYVAQQLGASPYAIYVAGSAAFSINSLTHEELRGRGHAEAALIAFNTPLVFAPFLCALISLIIDIGNISNAIIGSHIATSILISFIYIYKTGGLKFSIKNSFRNLKTLSKTDLLLMSIQKFLSGGMSHLIILFTSLFGNPALTAFVAVAARLAGLAATFTGIVNATFAKKVGASVRSAEKQTRLFLTTCAATVLGVSSLMAPILILPSLFLSVFDIDKTLEGATLALQILALARILRAFAGISDLFLMVSGQAYKELLSALAGILALALGMLLYPADTAVGAALSLGQAVVTHGAISALFVLLRASR